MAKKQIGDQEFLTLLDEKKHKELIGVMTDILTHLSTSSPSETIIKLLKQIVDKPDKKDNIPTAVNAIGKLIIAQMDRMEQIIAENSNTSHRFDIYRDEKELTTHVIVTKI